MRICMVAYTFYESDNRVLRYAETLVKRGDHVDIFCLRNVGQTAQEGVNGVWVYRVQNRIRNERSKWTYLFRILVFFLRTTMMLSTRHLTRPYDLVHVHSVPDFLVFVAWLLRLTGCPIILDIHDLAPELFASKFNGGRRSLLYRILLMEERLSASLAQQTIIANHLWEKRIVS